MVGLLEQEETQHTMLGVLDVFIIGVEVVMQNGKDDKVLLEVWEPALTWITPGLWNI